MGQRQSNPVLEVLAGQRPETERKYPHGHLCFGGNPWRAYYHCHDAPERPEGEHGHFHIFRRQHRPDENKYDWLHLAGLSMDGMGQPLAWFTVNAWVTGDPLRSATVPSPVPALEVDAAGSDLERWLLAMVGLYRAEIEALLAQRDQRLRALAGTRNAAEIMQDRAVYVLSRMPIDLVARLQRVLLAEQAHGAED